jgi:hypothetical protein
MVRRLKNEYDNCRGNVPTKPMGLADWVLAALITLAVIGFWVFVV